MEYNELSWRERGRLWLRLGIRLVVATIGVLMLVFVAPPLLSLLMPFVLAFLMAWLLNPLVKWIQNKCRIPRGVTSLVLIVLLFGGAGGLLFYFGYTIVSELQSLLTNWEVLWQSIKDGLDAMTAFLTGLFEILPDDVGAQAVALLDQFVKWLQTVIPSALASFASQAGSVAMSIPSWIVATVIFIMGWYFITADYPHIRYVFTEHLPPEFRGFLSKIKKSALGAFGGYVKAQIILAIVVFFILLLGFTVIGQGYSVLLALLLAVLDFIPIVGSGTIMVPWAVVDIFTGDLQHAIELMVIWGVIALFRQVAEPKVVGNQTGLSPILSLVSIYVGMRLGGVPGMILGPILCMVVVNLGRSGGFDGISGDLRLAIYDTACLLKNRPRVEDEIPPVPPEEEEDC